MGLASGQTHIKPEPWVAVATAALFVAYTATIRDSLAVPRARDLAAAVVIALAASHLFFFSGFPIGHDTPHHLWGIWAVFKALRQGDLYPQWLHHLGMGMPLLRFYPPGSFLLIYPLALLPLPVAVTLKGAFLFYACMASCTMYYTTVRWTQDRRAALVAALAYVWAPYALLDSHYRIALAESAALIWFPLVFGAVERLAHESGRRIVLCAAVSFALLLITHPISAVIACSGAAVWLTVAWWPLSCGFGVWLAKLSRLLAALAIGLLLSAFYLLPLLSEARYTSLARGVARQEGQPLYAEYGLVPADLLSPRRWSEVQFAHSTAQRQQDGAEEMPHYVGLVLLALIPLAAGWLHRRSSPDGYSTGRDLRRSLVVVTLMGILLPLRPWDRIFAHVPFIAALQYPWRFLSLATFGLAACAGFATRELLNASARFSDTARWPRLIPGGVAALLLWDAFPYSGAVDWSPPYEGVAFMVPQDDTCGARFGCWETHPIEGDLPLRAAGLLLLPPADYEHDLSRVGFVYPELYSPALWTAFYEPHFGPQRDEVLRHAGVGLVIAGQPPSAQVLKADPYAELLSDGHDPIALGFNRKAGRISLALSGEGGRVVVREQWFPGWMVRTADGLTEATPTAAGFLQASARAGQTSMTFEFLPRWPEATGEAVSLIAAGVAWLAFRKNRIRE